jgi:4'-phosphopantetheinyl transferase
MLHPHESCTLGRVTPGPGEVHIWYRVLEGFADGRYADAWAVLTPDERARAARFVHADVRETFVCAHGLLRTVLSAYTGVAPASLEFVAGASGKPALAPGWGDVQFNLSHATGLVACVVSREPVGVDVEWLDRQVPALDLATRFFSPPEVSWLTRAPEDERHVRFLELWTLKEAYVKGIGTGLSHRLDTFGFSLDALPSIQFDGPTHEESRAWQFALYAPSPSHRLAVAVRGAEGAATQLRVCPDEKGVLLGRS